MSYNYAKEIKKWKQWKQEEEALLRLLGVDEELIVKLRDYDYQVFLEDRRIRSRQSATQDTFFLNIPYYDTHEIKSVHDLLDNIENEILFNQLSKTDPQTLNILLLKTLGYSIKEVSNIMNISERSIYNRIHRLKKNLKNFISGGKKG